MPRTRRFIVALAALVAIVAVGSVGYVLLEGLSPTDAAYLTVMTLTTVGYGDIVPRTPVGRLFTIGLILSGLGTVLYLVSVVAELVLEGHLREFFGRSAMERRLENLHGHVIVCGYGRFGRVVVQELRRNDADVVVIDTDPAREEELKAATIPYVIGSGLSDDVLEHAGLARARAIVLATPSDPDNVFITLSVRERHPDVRIHARAETEAGVRRLELAGATQAISGYYSGGVRIAASILRPSVVDFLELSLPGHHDDIALEEMRLDTRSALAGKTIADVERMQARLRIVGLRRGDNPLDVAPDPATQLVGGDLLVVIGERARLVQLAQAAAG